MHPWMDNDAYATLHDRFIATLGADRVIRGERCANYTIDNGIPAIVVTPHQIDEVAAALRLAMEAEAAVAPWGGGTQMSLGYPLTQLDIVLSLEHLDAIRDYDAAQQTVTLEAGCTIAKLNHFLSASGQLVALDGALTASATIGGRIATGTTGLRRATFGSPREQVTGLTIARSDGGIMRTGGGVVRYVVGYDLNKIFVGSLGTLGVIVEATLRVTPLPEYEGIVVSSFSDPSFIWPLLADLQAAQMHPSAIAIAGPGTVGSMDDLSTTLAEQLSPATNTLLIVRLGSTRETAQRAALFVRQIALKYGAGTIVMLRDEALQGVWQALDDLPATRDLPDYAGVIKVSALPTEIGKVIEMSHGFAREHDLRLHWLGDAQTGNIWLRATGDPAGTGAFGDALVALQEALAWRWRNAVVLGCPPGLKHRLPLWGAAPQGLELMRAIKIHFDPAGIMNPGRFVGRI